MRLSVCIATYNEEAFLHYPLDSVIDIADEIIIVDGGSSDKTLEIARSYGEKVKTISVDNPPMFHINKQRSLDAAAGEWVLQLDADEALSPQLKAEILSILDSSDAKVAYWLPRKNFFLKRFLEKGGQYPDYTIRLYRRGQARFPCKSVHENVEILKSAGGEPVTASEAPQYIGRAKEPLLHYADPDFARYLKRWDRYTTLDAELILKRDEHLSFVSYFFIKPLTTFVMMYGRHKGFMDGFPGFVFALFSSIRFWSIYIKVWQKR